MYSKKVLKYLIRRQKQYLKSLLFLQRKFYTSRYCAIHELVDECVDRLDYLKKLYTNGEYKK